MGKNKSINNIAARRVLIDCDRIIMCIILRKVFTTSQSYIDKYLLFSIIKCIIIQSFSWNYYYLSVLLSSFEFELDDSGVDGSTNDRLRREETSRCRGL